MTQTHQYAAITLALQKDPGQYGAAALFNQALTLALVHIEQPPPDRRGRLPAASKILDDLADTLPAADLVTLKMAVSATNAARHGRGGRVPTVEEVDALTRLDQHPRMGVLNDTARDAEWVQDVVADNESRAHADAYLATLDDDEVTRRIDTLPDHRTPGGVDEPEPQECPVCWNDTLLAVDCDDYGYGIGAGHCHVCSYYRGPAAANNEAFTMEAHRLTSKD